MFENQQDRDYRADDRDRLWGAFPRPCGEVRIPMSDPTYAIHDLLTPEQAARDYPLIRELAAKDLGHDDYKWLALEVIAELLVRKVIVVADGMAELEEAVYETADVSGVLAPNEVGFINPYRLFVCMATQWKCAICLAVLLSEKVKVSR